MTYAARQPHSHQPPLMSVNKTDSAPQPFPFFQVLRYFKAYCHEHPEVKAQHRSLFYFLLEVFEYRGKSARFQLNREDGMSGAGIGSKNTYLAALKQMQTWGFITYTPGKNGERAAIIEILPNKNTVPELGHWLGRCRDTDRDTDRDGDGTTKNTYNLQPITREREADASARAEKKRRKLEKKLSELNAQTAQPSSPPVAATPPTPDEPPFVPEPMPEGAVLPAFVDPRLSDDDPRKWESVPRDVPMVQEYIDTYPDPAVRARGKGKAHLFFEHYGSVGWKVLGKNGPAPIANWRYLIRQFQFREQSPNGTTGPRSTAPGNGTVATLTSYGGNRRRPVDPNATPTS